MGGAGRESPSNDTNGAKNGVEMNTAASNGKDILIPSGTEDGPTKKRVARTKSPSSTNGSVPGRRRARKSKSDTEKTSSSNNKLIKYGALFLLVAQMVGLVLLMRYSRTTARTSDQPLYLASTAVFVMEVMKLVICLVVVAVQSGSDFLSDLHHHILDSPKEILKLCVPSLLYTVQNNLLYLALTNLDAATYQVCYQLKILTTALFSAVLLQRKFSLTKWASLVVLTVGVAIVQISGSGDQHSSSNTTTTDHHHESLEAAAQQESRNRFVGLIAVLCAACTSGFSGVYFGRFSFEAIMGHSFCDLPSSSS